MLSPPDSPRGKLLSQYVLVRLTQMNGVDVGLFDHDKHNTLYYYAMNADERIYLRYGGRDPAGHTTYLDLESLSIALEKGLELHREYQAGAAAPRPRHEPVYPRDFPLLVRRTLGRGRCVECHLIADFRNQQREVDGVSDRRRHMYRSPDIKTIGLWLDVPKGLVVKEVRGAAAEAGVRGGDRITHLEGERVYTFGDLQYFYDKVDRDARRVLLNVDRDGASISLPVDLPEYWWVTNLAHRQWTIEPRVYFKSKPLSPAEKRLLGLDPEGFAGRVSEVDGVAELLGAHELLVGDVVFAVDGATRDEHANTPELHVKLRKKSGSAMELGVLREGERLTMPLRTARMSFRK